MATRRSTENDGRTASSARTRAALVEAARDEFAERGYAGARVASIAERAGVNKQLISYHFGGKLGLFQQLQQDWLAREREMRADAPSFGELLTRYLSAGMDDDRSRRMALRQQLDGESPGGLDTDAADVEDLRRRQRDGEIAADLDPELLLVAITGMVSAPHLRVTGRPVDRDAYAELLRRIAVHLAG